MGGPARQIWTEVGEYKISYRGEHAENGERFILFYERCWLLQCEALGFVNAGKFLTETIQPISTWVIDQMQNGF